MISIRALPHLLSTWKTKREAAVPKKNPAVQDSKGHGLLRLHEYQHRVIVEIFKVSIIGFSAFIFVLLSFALYSLFNPFAPLWVSGLLMLFGAVLVLGLYRTVREFRNYRENYAQIAAHLRAKLVQKSKNAPRTAGGETPRPAGENRLLTALKPREHEGWDHKNCVNCSKTIELLSNVCQHCGQEQENLLVN